jgi:hypothetical protein
MPEINLFVIGPNNQLWDICPLAGLQINDLPDPVITFASNIPDPGKEPAAFDDWLSAWHKQHNGHKSNSKRVKG